MFGLTLEKLVLIAVITGLVIGPERLTHATRTLTTTIRSLRRFVDANRARASDELGVPLTRVDWQALDLRRYDPRRIVRDALASDPETESAPAAAAETTPDPSVRADPGEQPRVVEYVGLDRVRPGQRYLSVGDSAHPRRIRLSDLPADDPRRVRAEQIAEAGPSSVDGTAAADDGEAREALSDAVLQDGPRASSRPSHAFDRDARALS
ncbi:MAG: hypothetical protein PGN24_02475 [Microbacterium arborescens]